MKNELTVGRILKPRGLKGELKIETFSDNPRRFQSLKKLKIADEEYVVEKLSTEGALGYVKLQGIDDIDKAERLRGKEITVSRDDLPRPPEDRYYVVDMIGVDVFVGGDKLGQLTDILQYGSADVYVIRTSDAQISVPAIKDLITDVNLEEGKLVLNDRVFPRVAVYN